MEVAPHGRNGYFDHNDPAPVSRTAFQRATDCGYGGGWWGENIAWGYTPRSPSSTAGSAPPGHKANIENANFTSTGVGVAANAVRPALLDTELRHRRRRQPATSTSAGTFTGTGPGTASTAPVGAVRLDATTTSAATQSTVPAGTNASQPPAAALRVGARPPT